MKIHYTTSLLVLKYFLFLTCIYDCFINYKVRQLYLFYNITIVVFIVSIIVLHTQIYSVNVAWSEFNCTIRIQWRVIYLFKYAHVILKVMSLDVLHLNLSLVTCRWSSPYVFSLCRVRLALLPFR